MITEIPTSGDFRDSGIAFLNLAWDSAALLHSQLEDAKDGYWFDNEEDFEREVPDQYWTAAQRPLATAVTLIQQGLEFLIKGRITESSPFFLISKSPSDWPKDCNTKDTSFADFKTVDAQDLVRVHDTVCSERLPEVVAQKFDILRRQRNTIMHTVDPRMRFTAFEVFRDILALSDALIGERAWVSCRREYLESGPESVAYSPDHVDIVMIRESRRLLTPLQSNELSKFFGYFKRQRSYFCPNCHVVCRDHYEDAIFAQLQPNTSESTNLHCFVCERDFDVLREPCSENGCKGNVLEPEQRTCLSCSTNIV